MYNKILDNTREINMRKCELMMKIAQSYEILLYPLGTQNEKIKPLIKNIKGEGKEWAYYPTHNVGGLYVILKALKLRRIIDLGSGLGCSLKAINIVDPTIKFEGLENEPALVQGALIPTKLKDIILLTKEDINNSQAVYFYEPIRDLQKLLEFIKNLITCLKKEQYIIYYPAVWKHQVDKLFIKSRKVKNIFTYSSFSVYKVIK